jgi:hypothetical protein
MELQLARGRFPWESTLRADTQPWLAENVLYAALAAVALVWIAFLVSRFCWIFGGDPEIHLIFARNFLHGGLLEFNPGLKTGGETSPLYMLMVAGGYILLGSATAYGMKAVAYLALAGICCLAFVANTSAPVPRRWLYVLLLASMPFFVFQASLGMENMLFAAAVVTLVHVRYRGADRLLTLTFPVVMPVLFLLRPEAVFVALWLGCLALAERRIKDLLIVVASVGITYALYVLLNRYTGVETHNAGLMRAYLSTLISIRMSLAGHDIFVSTRALLGMCYALPFLAYAGFRHRALLRLDWLTLGALFCVPAVLHVFNVLPNTQFSRYFLFEYAVLLYVFASRFLATLEGAALAAIGLVTLLFAGAEIYSRATAPAFNVADSIRETSPEAVAAYSDSLIAALHPKVLPVSIATQEVQLRGRLDNRFVVWSLDGITDFHLGNHLRNGYVDHFGYIRDRHIEFVLGLQDYNRDPHAPSLLDFQPGVARALRCIEGLRLEPTGVDKIFRVLGCTGSQPD